MGCSSSIPPVSKVESPGSKVAPDLLQKAELLRAVIIIQTWFRRFVARMEIRRKCSWEIFQEMEYVAESDHINLHNFFIEMVANVNKDSMLLKTLNDGDLGNGFVEDDLSESLERKLEFNGANELEDIGIKFPIDLYGIRQLLEYFKQRKLLPLSYVKRILYEAVIKLKSVPNVSNANIGITKQMTIVGDLHGKLDDLLTIFYKNGLPSNDNPYIFNGDFIDRGKQSVEVLLILCTFFILYPNQVHLNRGNHEDYIINSRYGFLKELKRKYQDDAHSIRVLCKELFSWLPLATIVGSKIFVVHGGISDRTDLSSIMQLQRNQFVSILKPVHILNEHDEQKKEDAIREWEQVMDLLWSDPHSANGVVFNKHRGGGCCFGPDITESILKKHNWTLLIRSHECKFEGYEYTHDKRVLTIFSVSSYYADSSNYGAYVKVDADLNARIIQFSTSSGKHINTLTHRIGLNEKSAMKALRRNIYAHREELLATFKKYEKGNSKGRISISNWAAGLEEVLNLKLPWHVLRPQLSEVDADGNVLYETCLEGYEIESSLPQVSFLTSEAIYRHKQALETVFIQMDQDCSGFISTEEFADACKLLNGYSNGIIPESSISDLGKTLDINKDGKIDFNEFLEAFRLVSLKMEGT